MAIISRITAHDQIQNDDQDKHGLSLAWRLTGGIPNNVTTEMDLKLWQTAKTIQDDDSSRTLFQTMPAQILARQYLQQSLPPAAQEAIRLFMNLYGMRGIGELDLGRPRWREDPTHIIQVLQNYMGIENEQLAPDKVFDEGRRRSFKVLDDYTMAMRSAPLSRLKAGIIRWLTIRMRTFAGLRESPKFLIIRIMGILRKGFLEVGSELADAGVIRSPDDLFFLNLAQLEALSRREIHGWAGIIAKNRERYARELKRRQIPRVLISDGRAFHEGVITLPVTGETILQGMPVSAGSVEGTARIVFDPLQAHLSPGDIMVCTGTDPAWTPLFLAISGLVMEMGGVMTHGSVVAREYGIPAVVGVNQVTRLIKNGQHIRVDGSTGRITVLDNQ